MRVARTSFKSTDVFKEKTNTREENSCLQKLTPFDNVGKTAGPEHTDYSALAYPGVSCPYKLASRPYL